MTTDALPGLNVESLLSWFQEHVAPVNRLRGAVIGHGRSNLTYRLECGSKKWVLRRPPLTHRQPAAHDMAREFRAISSLSGSSIPVPQPIAFCSDIGVIGAPFYVMEYIDGIVPSEPDLVEAHFTASQRGYIGQQIVEVLVRLHEVVPEEVGLGDFGRPVGYLERQVRRFTEQLANAKTRDLPELEEVGRRLRAAVPRESGSAIVHGDYRIDNAILSADGRILALLDWELCTIGDPLADLGALHMYWAQIGDDIEPFPTPSNRITALAGFPTWRDVVEGYAALSGRDLVSLDFYSVLAHFRLAVILENMHARYLAGGTVGAGFASVGDSVPLLARRALAIADASELHDLRCS